ncbi:S8 family peptidase [Bdellovibrionota bacterium FG-1]
MKNQITVGIALLLGLVSASQVWSAEHLQKPYKGSESRELLMRVPPSSRINALSHLQPLVSKLKKDLGLRGVNPIGPVASVHSNLLKLNFATSQGAAEARKLIRSFDPSAHVSINALYRPAMNFKIQKTKKSSALLFPLAGQAVPSEDSNSEMIELVENPLVWPAPENVEKGADPLALKDWALKNIGFPLEKSEELVSNSSIITAVIDTGVDYNHEDLAGAMWRTYSEDEESDEDIVGWDFAHDTARPYDRVKFDFAGCLADPVCKSGADSSKFLLNAGHGTHCAGHVAAVAQNSRGIRGLGAGAQLMGLKFFFDEGEKDAGQGSDLGAIQAIDYAIEHGVRVINASWGGRMPRVDGEASELKQALIRAQAAGLIVVIAAGNEGIDQDAEEEPSYPAAYELDNLIVVAASDGQDNLADFSNYGVKSVHLAAPGVRILSTISGAGYSNVVASATDKEGNEYTQFWDGTSMAAPIVAGAVALVWSKFPAEDYRQIRERILRSTRHVEGLEGLVATGGILDISAAYFSE